MSKSNDKSVCVIAGRFSRVFESSKDSNKKTYFINFYVMGCRFLLPAPKFEVLPDTDYIVTLELSLFSGKDSKGYSFDSFKPVTVLEVEPI